MSTTDNTPQTSPEAPTSYMPGATPPVTPAPGSAPGYGPPYAPQPWPYQGPPAAASHATKRTNRRNWIVAGVAIVVLLAVGLVAAAIAAGNGASPSATSTYQPIYGNGAPAAPVTTGPTYPNPVAADFQITPKITQKQCFGSAGCNVTFTVDLAYVGKGAKPNSTWDITYDGVGTEDALTDTITLHFDATGAHGTYDSKEEMVQTKKSSDVITLKITAISPGIG